MVSESFAGIYDTDGLRQLIAENPDLPIMVMAGECASDGEHRLTVCSSVSYSIKEVLDTEPPYDDELLETDRNHFREEMESWLWDKQGDDDIPARNNEEEFKTILEEKLKEYDKYWIKVICITVDN